MEDLEKSKAFFEHYFKAQAGAQYHNKKTNFRSYFLTFEGGARLEIMTRDDLELQAKPHTRTGFAHIAFSLGSKEKVDSLTEQLVLDVMSVSVVQGPLAMVTMSLAFWIVKAIR